MTRWSMPLVITVSGAACLVALGIGLQATTTLVVGTLYASAARVCMWLADGLLSPHLLWIAVGSLVGLTLTTVLAAGVQLNRTRKLVASLAPLDSGALPYRVRRLVNALGLQGRLDFVDHPALIAFTHGLFRPRIVLSRRLIETFENDELEAVLRHERAHTFGLDPLRVLLVRSLSTAFAFVPFVSSFLETYLARRELRADGAVVSEMGDVMPLAAALQRTIDSYVPRQPQELAGLAVGALSATDARIDQLLGVSTPTRLLLRPPGRLHATAFTLVLVVAICALVSSAETLMTSAACIRC